MRSYLLIAGGFDMPKILGSSATFTLAASAVMAAGRCARAMCWRVNEGGEIPSVSQIELAADLSPGDDTRVDDRCHSWTALYGGIFAARVFE